MKNKKIENKGLFLGCLAVMAFSLTLPLTKFLSPTFYALEIGFGRAFLAGITSFFILLFLKEPFPNKENLFKLALVALGVVFGFPIFVAIGMKTVPASHGGVVLGALPLSTAFFSFIFSRERPSPWFWLLSLIGFAAVAFYSLSNHPSENLIWSSGDLALLGAVIMGGMGYAQGGHLSKKLGGWRVICLSLVLSLPIVLMASPFIFDLSHFQKATGEDLFALAFLGLVNNLFAFFFWYKGLAIGGVARVGQMQLFQPFFTFFFAVLFLKEPFSWKTTFFAFFIVFIVFLSKKTKIKN